MGRSRAKEMMMMRVVDEDEEMRSRVEGDGRRRTNA